jgi:hypothetical protein
MIERDTQSHHQGHREHGDHGTHANHAATDVAIESAEVVLAGSDPRGVTGIIRLSRASYRKMLQNLGWAAGYNVVAIALAAGVLAWAGVTMPPAVGALLMSGLTVVVALNAQPLRRVDLRPAVPALGDFARASTARRDWEDLRRER